MIENILQLEQFECRGITKPRPNSRLFPYGFGVKYQLIGDPNTFDFDAYRDKFRTRIRTLLQLFGCVEFNGVKISTQEDSSWWRHCGLPVTSYHAHPGILGVMNANPEGARPYDTIVAPTDSVLRTFKEVTGQKLAQELAQEDFALFSLFHSLEGKMHTGVFSLMSGCELTSSDVLKKQGLLEAAHDLIAEVEADPKSDVVSCQWGEESKVFAFLIGGTTFEVVPTVLHRCGVARDEQLDDYEKGDKYQLWYSFCD